MGEREVANGYEQCLMLSFARLFLPSYVLASVKSMVCESGLFSKSAFLNDTT